MERSNQNIGSNFDDFLREENLFDEASAVAIKRVIAWQIAQAMEVSGVNKTTLAGRMHTSRAQLNRVLDENDTGLTLDTLSRAATALGYRVKFDLIAA
jgi:DNA-binding Xre family transcriptional regulator